MKAHLLAVMLELNGRNVFIFHFRQFFHLNEFADDISSDSLFEVRCIAKMCWLNIDYVRALWFFKWILENSRIVSCDLNSTSSITHHFTNPQQMLPEIWSSCFCSARSFICKVFWPRPKYIIRYNQLAGQFNGTQFRCKTNNKMK